MLPKVVLPIELLIAVLALELFDALVNFEMVCEIALLGEFHRAFSALKWVLLSVASQMVEEFVWRLLNEGALVAVEKVLVFSLLSSVSKDIDAEILTFGHVFQDICFVVLASNHLNFPIFIKFFSDSLQFLWHLSSCHGH